MPLPFGRVIEPGIDRAEFPGAFRAGRHTAELQRLRDLRLHGGVSLRDLDVGERAVVDFYLVEEPVEDHRRVERGAVSPLRADREGSRVAQAHEEIDAIGGRDRPRGLDFAFEFSIDEHLQARRRVVAARDMRPLKQRELGLRIALDPLPVLRHMQPEASIAADTEKPTLLVVPLLIENRRPVPWILLQRDPALEGKGVSEWSNLVGRAGHAGGESVENHGIADNPLGLAKRSLGPVMDFSGRVEADFLEELISLARERPPGGGLGRMEKRGVGERAEREE